MEQKCMEEDRRRGRKTERGRMKEVINCKPLLNISLLFDICRELEHLEKREIERRTGT